MDQSGGSVLVVCRACHALGWGVIDALHILRGIPESRAQDQLRDRHNTLKSTEDKSGIC